MGAIDLKSNISVGRSVAYGAKTSTATGTGVEVADYNSCCVVIDAGAWTDGTHTVAVQDSDDNSTFAAVADSLLDGTEPVIDGAADDDQQYYIGYKGNKRYVRVVVTVASATTGAIYGAYVILGNPKDLPKN